MSAQDEALELAEDMASAIAEILYAVRKSGDWSASIDKLQSLPDRIAGVMAQMNEPTQ